ncbi:hypothetical protein DPMN_103523 [Dreissena polymorpha]|uniref:Uncharacterized protein n=1 Tax=Dreissena polymorpha TaxID=45954 RepID=A0A9D4K2P0_DREPO|nr:hypothetical protein DPMN_103523 [Dreissena polymorpha]
MFGLANLQKFLQERDVVFSVARKPALVELCLIANSLGLELDPDGLKEDRTEVFIAKLTCESLCLRNPYRIIGTANLSFVPHFSIFDIYNHRLAFNEFDHAKLRDYHHMEGYTMAKDGFVVYLESVQYIKHR